MMVLEPVPDERAIGPDHHAEAGKEQARHHDQPDRRRDRDLLEPERRIERRVQLGPVRDDVAGPERLVDLAPEARGQVEGIGTSPRFSVKDGTGKAVAEQRVDHDVHDADSALGFVATWFRTRFPGAQLIGVGHRVVHGGVKYRAPAIVTPEVLEDLRQLVPLAPLHQPYNLAAIEAVGERLPDVRQVACFDTSFHRGQPEVATIVREGDVVMMPQGYHPNVAAPGGSINFLWMMAAVREDDDRQYGVVNVQPEFGNLSSGLDKGRTEKK